MTLVSLGMFIWANAILFIPGNVVNGTIGKQMVDMLVESSNNVEMILKFFDMFLKLKGLGVFWYFPKSMTPMVRGISKRDFHKAMESHKHYTQSETSFSLSCAERQWNPGLWRICQTVPRACQGHWLQCGSASDKPLWTHAQWHPAADFSGIGRGQ